MRSRSSCGTSPEFLACFGIFWWFVGMHAVRVGQSRRSETVRICLVTRKTHWLKSRIPARLVSMLLSQLLRLVPANRTSKGVYELRGTNHKSRSSLRIRNDLGGAEHSGQEFHDDAAVYN